MALTITIPDDFKAAEVFKVYPDAQMYFLWYGQDHVQGYNYDGTHVVNVPLDHHENSLHRAKIAISDYCKKLSKENGL